jgi:hypothetical protein
LIADDRRQGRACSRGMSAEGRELASDPRLVVVTAGQGRVRLRQINANATRHDKNPHFIAHFVAR